MFYYRFRSLFRKCRFIFDKSGCELNISTFDISRVWYEIDVCSEQDVIMGPGDVVQFYNMIDRNLK